MLKCLVQNDECSWGDLYYMQSLRLRANMVQREISSRTRFSISTVSNRENTKIEWWSLRDIISYAEACGYDTEVRFVKRSEEVREEANNEREVHQH